MIRFAKHGLVFAGAAFALTACSASAQRPEPPSQYIEFFTPTRGVSQIHSTCQTSSAFIQWSYDGSRNTVLYFSYDGDMVSSQKLQQLNEIIAPFDQRATVRMYCNDSGVQLSFFETDDLGGGQARQIRLQYYEGKIEVLRRSNF